jgi:hypothetical protein
MSFVRLPLALALSITLGGNLLLCAAPAKARPLLEGQTSCSGYSEGGSKVLLIAAKDDGDVSADSPAKGKANPSKEEKAAAKKAKVAADKEEKNTDKKAQKAEKANAKEKEVAEEGGEKKKAKGMFFHKKNNVEEEEKAPVEKKAAAPAAQAKKESAEAAEAKEKAEAKAPPVFVPDDALISVLKDVSKALADSQNEQVVKVENENEKVILGLAEEIFAKALTEPNLPSNRIVPKDEEHHIKGSITAESWSSGDIVVNDKLRGSMAAVWAKRIGGLLTVTIAGDAGPKKTPDGNTIGEFMVVITAHSPVQSGFDIQSQGDVTFWMGKLNNIMIEATCVPATETAGGAEKAETTSSNDTSSPSQAGGEAKKKLTTFISPLLTNRYRKYELLLQANRESQRQAAKLEIASEPEKSADEAAAGDDAKVASAKENESSDKEPGAKESGGKQSEGGKSGTSKAEGGKAGAPKTASNSKGGDNNKANNKVENTKTSTKDDKQQIASAIPAGNTVASEVAAAAVVDAGPHFRLPSASSTLLLPERALAGQYVTVALLDRTRAPEANVELSFNGASLATDSSGQALYQIPEDTTPGRSLNIALSARPDEVPATVEVLQPLNVTTGQPPRLDRMTPLAIKDSLMTIDGHNFDGMAHNNSVIVDGSLEGKIVSASPYQLKLLLPPGLRPGPHSLCVSTDGMRSNLGGFDYADTVLTVDGKDNGKENCNIKLVIKVIGTTAKMNVKILNQTPDVLRLNRGAEMTITSSGGFDNTVQVFGVRAKKGTFNVDTQIEM